MHSHHDNDVKVAEPNLFIDLRIASDGVLDLLDQGLNFWYRIRAPRDEAAIQLLGEGVSQWDRFVRQYEGN